MARRSALGLAALVPAAALLGCREDNPLIVTDEGGGSGGPSPGELEELFDRRAQAQLNDDEAGYLADLDESNEALIQWERMVFENLRQFPLSEVQYLLPAPRPIAGQGEAGPFRYAPVVKVVKLTTDDGPDGVVGPGESFEYSLARRGDRWIITDTVPLTAAELASRASTPGPSVRGLPSASSPWNLQPLQVINVANVWLAGDESVSDLDRYADAAGIEAEHVEGVWGNRPAFPGHVLFFTRDQATLGEWFDLGEEFVDTFAGVAVPRPGVRRNGELYPGQNVSARMAINLTRTEQYTQDPRSTMRHELVHAITARGWGAGDDRVWPASWAVEGYARFIQVRGDSSREQQERALAARNFEGAMPRTGTFYDGDNERVAANYALGYVAFALIEQIRDLATATDFYAEVCNYNDAAMFLGTEPTPFVEVPAFDGICRRVLGMDAADFLNDWAAAVQQGG